MVANMNKRLELPYWIQLICMAFMTFSLLQGYYSITARAWLWVPLSCAVCIYMNTKVLRSMQIVWYMLNASVVLLNTFAGKSYNSPISTILILSIMLWALSFPFLFQNGINEKFVKYFAIMELVIVIITSVLTIIVDSSLPGIVRQTVTFTIEGRSELALQYYRLGVCEYGLPHAIPIIMPAIVMYARTNEFSVIKRLVSLIIILILGYFVFISGVTTAILLFLFSIAASSLISINSRKKSYRRIIILCVFALPLVNDNVILSILSGLEEIVPAENSFNGKLISMENTIRYGEADGSVDAREEKYNISLQTFLNNPIIGGNGAKNAGGHSIILDSFSAYGLIGGIPLLLLILYHLSFVYKILSDKYRLTFIIGAICFIAMLATKNMSNVYTWMFVSAFLPILLFYEQIELEKNEY